MVKRYDGYNFSGADMYNPWSVIQYFQEGCKVGAYWVNTSGNGIIRKMLSGMEQERAEDLHRLMEWKTVAKQVSEGGIYEDIVRNSDDLYTLFGIKVELDLINGTAELSSVTMKK